MKTEPRWQVTVTRCQNGYGVEYIEAGCDGSLLAKEEVFEEDFEVDKLEDFRKLVVFLANHFGEDVLIEIKEREST